MGSGSVHLRGTRALRPLAQGDYSHLCGLYSFINAIQLSSWAVHAEAGTLRELYKFGINYLSRRRQLARVMVMGMDQELWLELGSAVVAYSRDVLGMSLKLAPVTQSRPGSRRHEELERILRNTKRALKMGHPVLCGLGGALEHYTVLSGYSERRLTLFDSSGFSWIDIRSLALSENAGTRHWLYPDSVTALVDEW